MSPTSYLAALPRVSLKTKTVYQPPSAVSTKEGAKPARAYNARVTGWRVGDRLRHEHNPELGTGRVVAVDGRSVVVQFEGGARLRLAGNAPALYRLAPDDPLVLRTQSAVAVPKLDDLPKAPPRKAAAVKA